MALTTETTSPNGKGAVGALHQRPAAPPTQRRRRQVPWIVAGVLLVVGSALAFGVASIRLSHGEDVLAVVQPVAAGQQLEPGDLRVVRISPDGGLSPVSASAEGSLFGRSAAVALVPGTLLTSGDLGSSSGTGDFDVVAMALKAGAYPPSLGPGEQVDVVPVVARDSSSGSTAPISGPLNPIQAVVVAVDATPAGSSADAVVSLEVQPSDATEVATLAAAGEASLIQLPSGSGS